MLNRMLVPSRYCRPLFQRGADGITLLELRPVALAQSRVVQWILKERRKAEKRGDERGSRRKVSYISRI